MLQLLLQCGADIQAQNDQGDTPLHLLANRPDTASMFELSPAGFNPSIEEFSVWERLRAAMRRCMGGFYGVDSEPP